MPETEHPPGPLVQRFRGKQLVVLAAVLWSTAGVFIKLLDLPPVTISFYRFLFAALFFLLFLRRSQLVFNGNILISVATYVTATGTFVVANKLTTAANAIVLQYTAPIYIYVLAAVLFKERITVGNLWALCGGMAGIGVIFFGTVGDPEMAGVFVALLSGFVFGLYIVNLRFLPRVSPIFLVFANNLGGVLVFFPLAFQDLVLSLSQLVALMAMGVFQFGAAYFVFSKGVEKISLQEASLLLLLEPVLNPLWVNILIGEFPSLATFIGGAVIVGSLVIKYSVSIFLERPVVR
jgi:drug/metabolite transporter (DMT)-like permease